MKLQVLSIRSRLSLVSQGAAGGLIGSLCCLLPAMAISIGLTGGLAATFVSLGRFRLYGIVAGLTLTALASWIFLRRTRSCCSKEEYSHRRLTIPLTMFVTFSAVYGLIMYVIVPILY